MKEGNVFPYDHDTLWIIIEMEAYLGLQHKNINNISKWELHEYINCLAILLH